MSTFPTICSQCGVVLLLSRPPPAGTRALCARCADVWRAAGPAPAPAGPPRRESRPAPARAPRRRRAEEASEGMAEAGLHEDASWQRLQARQRKRALVATLGVV